MALVKMNSAEAKRKGRADPARLRATTDADIRRHEREDGGRLRKDAPNDAVCVSPSAVREKFKMTQAVFARTLRIPLATLRNWEQQRTMPDPAARALFTILYRTPGALKTLTNEVASGSPAGAKITRERASRR